MNKTLHHMQVMREEAEFVERASYNYTNATDPLSYMNPNYTAHVIGHTDDRGLSYAEARIHRNTIDLAYDRASQFSHRMIEDYKVDPTRLVVSSRGEFEPIATNDTSAGQRRNRRIEVKFVPKAPVE